MEINDIVVPSATAGIASLFTWIFGRKKENADISNVQLEASQKVIDMITAMNDRLEAKVNDLSKKVDELTEEVIHLRTENSKLKSGKQPK
jgi:peptidoglycan hydrolase CwlO-like protein